MSEFGNYARYYDILYRDKTYGKEAAFVLDLIRNYCPEVDCVLELGCGTGGHAQHLAEAGIRVHGVDRSPQMLERATRRQASLPLEVAERLVFALGDACELRVGKTFDAVISLFHVVSYQTSNADLSRTFATAREHLRSGGVFVFDCWYGPGVLSERPSVRVKHWDDESIDIRRIAEPILQPNENVVDVNYTVFVRDKANGRVEELNEVHHMRYLFRPEVEMFASLAGLRMVEALEWMTQNEPGLHTWNACFVIQG